MAAKKRKDFLDIAKGIAMIWIMAVHADGAIYTGTLGYVTLIPLFFFTGGFLWKDKTDPPYRLQMKKRADALLKPYFVWNLFLFIPFLLDWVPYLPAQAAEAKTDILRHIFGVFYSEGQIWMNDTSGTLLHYFTTYNYPLWFLTAMVTASAAYIVLLLLRRRFHIPLWSTIPFCILITVLTGLLPIRLPWNLSNCFLAAALMAAGSEIRRWNLLEREWRHRWAELLCYLAAFFAALGIGIWNQALTTSMLMSAYGVHGHWGPAIYFVGGVLAPCVALRLCRFLEGKKISRPLIWLGQNTISLLAIHRTLITIYNRVWAYAVGPRPDFDTVWFHGLPLPRLSAASAAYFRFSLPRLAFAAAGSAGLILLGHRIRSIFRDKISRKA